MENVFVLPVFDLHGEAVHNGPGWFADPPCVGAISISLLALRGFVWVTPGPTARCVTSPNMAVGRVASLRASGWSVRCSGLPR